NTCLKIDENMKTDIDLPEMQMLTIIEGVCDLDGKLLFKNKELMDKFKAPTPKELARKLLLPGEITNLYRILQDVMGYGKNAVIEEVKN
ncbi:TPA: phage portal protein, partial [Clostridioides difficile]|nr:phage portal protein [Clostridioides difficile]